MAKANIDELLKQVTDSELALKIHQAFYGPDASSDTQRNLFLDSLVQRQIQGAKEYKSIIEDASKLGIDEEAVVDTYTTSHKRLIHAIGMKTAAEIIPKDEGIKKDQIDAYLHLATFHEARFLATGNEQSLQDSFRYRWHINNKSADFVKKHLKNDEELIKLLGSYSPKKIMRGRQVVEQKSIDVMLQFIDKSLYGGWKQFGLQFRGSPLKGYQAIKQSLEVLSYLKQYVDNDGPSITKKRFNNYRVKVIDAMLDQAEFPLKAVHSSEKCNLLFGSYSTNNATEFSRYILGLASKHSDKLKRDGVELPKPVADKLSIRLGALENHYMKDVYQPLQFNQWLSGKAVNLQS